MIYNVSSGMLNPATPRECFSLFLRPLSFSPCSSVVFLSVITLSCIVDELYYQWNWLIRLDTSTVATVFMPMTLM